MLNLKKLLTKILRFILQSGTQQFSGNWTIGSSGYVQLGLLPTPNGIVYSAIVSTWGVKHRGFQLGVEWKHGISCWKFGDSSSQSNHKIPLLRSIAFSRKGVMACA